MPVLSTHDLSKDYGGHRGIFHVDLAVQKGEVFGFIGPNGAGKSTTIRTILDLLRPTGGHVRLFGQDPRAHVALRARVGYLPGELKLPNTTGRVFLQDLAALRGGAPLLDDLVQRLGIDLDSKIRKLSKGNKQKLGIAQAFMHDPELLILDEPTDGLDPLLRQVVHALIDEAQARGRTVFLSSHVLHEVEQVCDRIAIIREGRVVAQESMQDLRRKAFRRIRAPLARPVPLRGLRERPGVSEVRVEKGVVHVAFQGPSRPIVAWLLQHGAKDIDMDRDDLEDVVLSYYGVHG